MTRVKAEDLIQRIVIFQEYQVVFTVSSCGVTLYFIFPIEELFSTYADPPSH